MTIRPFAFVVLMSFPIACEKQEQTQQQPSPSEKGSGVDVGYKDPGTSVTADPDESKSLIYWYDARNKTLNVFDQKALELLMEQGTAKEIKWTPGQVVAQVVPGPGMPPLQAQVATFSAIDTPPDAIYASVGDMRRLKSYRERFILHANRSGSLTDLNYAPVWLPGGTTAYVVLSRYHEYLQHTGTIQAPEFVENTVRYEFYPLDDSLACRSYATTDDRKPKWVTAVQNWP